MHGEEYQRTRYVLIALLNVEAAPLALVAGRDEVRVVRRRLVEEPAQPTALSSSQMVLPAARPRAAPPRSATGTSNSPRPETSLLARRPSAGAGPVRGLLGD